MHRNMKIIGFFSLYHYEVSDVYLNLYEYTWKLNSSIEDYIYQVVSANMFDWRAMYSL